MIIKISCPRKCCINQPKIEARFNEDMSHCAVRRCERVGEIEVEVSGITFWMCFVHASGHEMAKRQEVMG